MRSKKAIFFTILSSVLLLGLLPMQDNNDALWKRLGLSRKDAADHIWWSFVGQSFSHPRSEQIKAIVRGDRASIVHQLAEFAKHYVKSEEFKKLYDEQRETTKPTEPEKPKSSAELRKEQKEEGAKNLAEMEKNMKTLSAEQQAQLKPAIDMMRAQLKELDDPNNPLYGEQTDAMYKMEYDQKMADYKQKCEAWEREWPAGDPDPMIRSWLERFLEASEGIEYNAKLIDGPDGKKLFALTEYENKPSDWKLCYRIGKEAIEAGRKEASSWLKELK